MVERSLSMREVPGSIPGFSRFLLKTVTCFAFFQGRIEFIFTFLLVLEDCKTLQLHSAAIGVSCAR